jgi:hypothetical protein
MIMRIGLVSILAVLVNGYDVPFQQRVGSLGHGRATALASLLGPA